MLYFFRMRLRRAIRIARGQPSMPDDHSPLEPPLPIPNRTVKRRHADDSVDYPCESRSSSGTLKAKAHPCGGPFALRRAARVGQARRRNDCRRDAATPSRAANSAAGIGRPKW